MTIGLGDGRSACIKSSGVYIRGRRVHRFAESAGNSISNVDGSNGELWIGGKLVVPRLSNSRESQRGDRAQNVVMGSVTSGVRFGDDSGLPRLPRRAAIRSSGDVRVGSSRARRAAAERRGRRYQIVEESLGIGQDGAFFDDIGPMLGELRRRLTEHSRRERRGSDVRTRRRKDKKK